MSNKKEIEAMVKKIYSLESEIKYETNTYNLLELNEELLESREKYTQLLLKKRKTLLVCGIVFAIFYGISLCCCLPPYSIRGTKRDINEAKIVQIKHDIKALKRKIYEEQNPNLIEVKEQPVLSDEDKIIKMQKEIDELKRQLKSIE